MWKPFLLKFTCGLLWITGSLFAEPFSSGVSSRNSGYSVEIKSIQILPKCEGFDSPSGRQWLVLELQLVNHIDPFLVFDYGIAEDINILKLEDRMFVLSGEGHLSRVETLFFGKDRFFGQNIKLSGSGAVATGKVVFSVNPEDCASLEFQLLDESFQPIRIPLRGKVELDLLASGMQSQENQGVALAVGDHGPLQIEGKQARSGMQFYFVDLWGQSRFQRTVAAYYQDVDADPNAKVKTGFYFEYKGSRQLCQLVTDGQYAYDYLPEDSLGLEVNPAYVPGKWTRSRMVFEVPVNIGTLELQTLFGKMGLSEESQEYLDGLRFPLVTGENRDLPTTGKVEVVDTQGSNQLTVSLALVPDLDVWGVDADDWIGLWVRFENTGSEAGMLSPSGRFWFDVQGKEVFCDPNQPTNVFFPPENLFLTTGFPRSMLLLYRRDVFKAGLPVILNYSGIGTMAQLEVDLDNGEMTLINERPEVGNTSDQTAFNSGESSEQLQPPSQKSAESVSKPMVVKKVDLSKSKPVKPSSSIEPVKKEEPQMPEVRVTPYELKMPQGAYHDAALATGREAASRLRQLPWLEMASCDFATFEQHYGKAGATETEDNNKAETANPTRMDITSEGVLETGGRDFWKLTISETLVKDSVRFDLLVAFPQDQESFKGLYCYLYDHKRQQVFYSWVDAKMPYQFRNLKLPAGEYYLEFVNYDKQPDAPYRFQFRHSDYSEKVETEPNTWDHTFLSISPGEVVSGLMGNKDDRDYFTWNVSPVDSRKRCDIIVVTDQPDISLRVSMFDQENEEIYRQDGEGEIILGDFSPPPGVYHIAILNNQSEPVRYHLSIIQRGSAQVGWEHEPNDVIHFADVSPIENFDDTNPEHLGRLEAPLGDYFAVNVKDRNSLYHVSIGATQRVTLSYWDKRKGRITSITSNGSQPAVLVDLRLPLGLNYFSVEGEVGNYAINVQQVPIPGETYEWEPNNTEGQAQLMQLGTSYQGRLLSNYDDDWYRVVVKQAMNYVFRLDAPIDAKLEMDVQSDGFSGKRQTATPDKPVIEYRVHLIPGDYRIKLEATVPSLGFYQIHVDPDPTPLGQTRGEIPGLKVEALKSTLPAAAFLDDFQQVVQSIRAENTGTSPLSLNILASSANYLIRPGSGVPDKLVLAPGEIKLLDVPWILEPQIPGSEDTDVFVGLESGGVVTFAVSRIDPSTETIAENILPGRQKLDDRLAGSLNLNASALGSKPVIAPATLYDGAKIPTEDQIGYLIDGVLANRSFWGKCAVVELAGDGTQSLVGTSLDLHGRGNLWESVKTFAIDVSSDGTHFTEVFKGQLEPRTGDQCFVFKQAVQGRFARIRLLDTQSGEKDQVPHLGEWRVLANPLKPVSTLGDVNILDPKLGGHLIIEQERDWVYGFQHDRAARVVAFTWKNKQASDNYYGNARSVKIEISEDSPVGPWKMLGTFDISSADQGDALQVEIPLKTEPWARFVRFTWTKNETTPRTSDPEFIGLIEKPANDDYRSIIGEWDGPTQFAFREYDEKQKGNHGTLSLKRILSSNQKPYTLQPDTWVSSVAWINQAWEDWYSIDPVKTKKQLQFIVEAKPFVKVAVELMDSYGKPVPLQETTKGAYRKEFTFLASPGVPYKVHVFEPKRSIVYLWDVSGSMGRFVESIENAVLKFAEGIDPDSEKVQLLPFDEPPHFLTDGWSSDAYELQSLIRNYVAPSSSYAHLNLLEATDALRNERGTKAAIVITDCESSREVNEKLWDALATVKPAVFTFQTSDQTSGYSVEQDDMQDWAAVAGGFYHNTRAPSELDTAFEKVQAYLRRPAPYQIQMIAPELEPSFIEIRDGRDKSTIRNPENDGVLLIIDASASMRENLPDGQMKVTAAKAVIQDLVEHFLPKGVNFGLRVFGHRGGTDCASELMIPVAPLDVELVKQKLMFIRSSSLGNTALAEALGWAKEDLKNLDGLKRVVVLTDGQETCRGDPASVIADLAEAGLNVTVNIVGFTLTEAQVKADYDNWVKSTGGKYFDAQDADALGVALKEAMTPVELPKFEVYDSTGVFVKTGQVGDPAFEVESGTYQVKILDPDYPRTETVEAFETRIVIDYK